MLVDFAHAPSETLIIRPPEFFNHLIRLRRHLLEAAMGSTTGTDTQLVQRIPLAAGCVTYVTPFEGKSFDPHAFAVFFAFSPPYRQEHMLSPVLAGLYGLVCPPAFS